MYYIHWSYPTIIIVVRSGAFEYWNDMSACDKRQLSFVCLKDSVGTPCSNVKLLTITIHALNNYFRCVELVQTTGCTYTFFCSSTTPISNFELSGLQVNGYWYHFFILSIIWPCKEMISSLRLFWIWNPSSHASSHKQGCWWWIFGCGKFLASFAGNHQTTHAKELPFSVNSGMNLRWNNIFPGTTSPVFVILVWEVWILPWSFQCCIVLRAVRSHIS